MDSNKRNKLTLQEQNNLVELYLREKTKLTTFAKKPRNYKFSNLLMSKASQLLTLEFENLSV